MSLLDFNFVTTFYIRKIENKHRIMSPATNKVIFFISATFPITLILDAQQILLC